MVIELMTKKFGWVFQTRLYPAALCVLCAATILIPLFVGHRAHYCKDVLTFWHTSSRVLQLESVRGGFQFVQSKPAPASALEVGWKVEPPSGPFPDRGKLGFGYETVPADFWDGMTMFRFRLSVIFIPQYFIIASLVLLLLLCIVCIYRKLSGAKVGFEIIPSTDGAL
jgi:hypothetical protein